ncbi:MAG TPA: hypothetical protein PKW66_09095, partial [Polyangiaceae bacterium]|nr:hypothetical protein [Polyangiaceae bacterium]
TPIYGVARRKFPPNDIPDIRAISAIVKILFVVQSSYKIFGVTWHCSSRVITGAGKTVAPIGLQPS